jgi:hypothetical protein
MLTKTYDTMLKGVRISGQIYTNKKKQSNSVANRIANLVFVFEIRTRYLKR